MPKKSKKIKKHNSLIAPGHRACAGCGQLVSAKTVGFIPCLKMPLE
jgi:pyruvate/2-oxoacid:ferredoxin oxidoreductase beta subunit